MNQHETDATEQQPPAARARPDEEQPDGAAPGGPAQDDGAADQDLSPLEEAQRERDEYLELAQRTRAEFENYRKRVGRETADALVRGKAELAREMLPAIDNLDRAVRAAGISTGSSGEQPGEPESQEVSAHEALGQGIALVHRELEATLQRAGIESFDPAGSAFDPTEHEAVSTRPSDGADSGTILETLDRGWRLGGDVLRPARVVVSE